jgi:hypothetical protein
MGETGRGVKDGSIVRRRWTQRRAIPGTDAVEGCAPADRRGPPKAAQALVIVLVSVPAALLGVRLGTSSSTFPAPGGHRLPEATALVLPWAGSPLPPRVASTPRADRPTGGMSGPPSSGVPSSPGVTAPPTATASARVSASPEVLPSATPPPPAPATPSTEEDWVAEAASAPPFTPVAVQAEDAGNDRLLAEVTDCVQCDGGKRVELSGSGGYLVVYADVPVAGTWPLTLVYTTDTARTVRITVSGGSAVTATLAGTDDRTSPATTTLHVAFPAGRVAIRFDNLDGGAPAIDKVVIG